MAKTRRKIFFWGDFDGSTLKKIELTRLFFLNSILLAEKIDLMTAPKSYHCWQSILVQKWIFPHQFATIGRHSTLSKKPEIPDIKIQEKKILKIDNDLKKARYFCVKNAYLKARILACDSYVGQIIFLTKLWVNCLVQISKKCTLKY